MMTEQQMTLSDDLQRKWKLCIRNTCYPYRLRICCEALIHYWNKLSDMFNEYLRLLEPFAEKLSEVFKDINNVSNNVSISNKRKSYPHGYPPYVHKIKVNKIGYCRPVTKRARSRCK